MKYATLQMGKPVRRDIVPDFLECYDLIIVGLGTAGAISCVAAARGGLRVLGVEALGGMGGTGTFGFVDGYYFGARGGLYEEINEEARKLAKDCFTEGNLCDTKAMALEDAARRAGARLTFETVALGVFLEGRDIAGLRLAGDGRIWDVRADAVIDATGEATVCRMAGCETRRGRKWDRQTQPYTNSCAYVDDKGRRRFFNKDAGYAVQTDADGLGEAVLRANLLNIYLKDHYEGAPAIAFMSSLLGAREGITVVGRETLSFEDQAIRPRRAQKPLFYAFSNVDDHGKDIAFESEALVRWYAVANLWGVLFSVGVPMGALLPREIDNLIVAGRCISVEHDLASAVRMKSDMEKCGEAAAVLAILAHRLRTPAPDIDPERARDMLRKTGCLNEENNMGFILRREGPVSPENAVRFSKEPGDILASLRGDAPGPGLWASYLAGQRALPALLDALRAETDPDAARRIALAAGMAGGEECLPRLRDMLTPPDHTIDRTSIKYNYTRATAAICLIGFLGDESFSPLLLDILDGIAPDSAFASDEFYADEEDLRSEYALFAIRALTDIAARHPGAREDIYRGLEARLDAKSFSLRVTAKANPSWKFDLAETARAYARHRARCD